MGRDKPRAHELALVFYRNTGRNGGVCDTCSTLIEGGQGFLSEPGPLHGSSPDLLCESCFDRNDWAAPYSGTVPTKDPLLAHLERLEAADRKKGGCASLVLLALALASWACAVLR